MSKLLEERIRQNEFLKLPYLVLVVSLLLTAGATYLFYQNSRARDFSRFKDETKSVKNRIEVLINSYIATIKAGRSFIQSTENLNQKKFANFVQELDLSKNYNGIKGLGYTKKVLPDERDSLITQMQKQGFADFHIFPADAVTSENQTIIYIEPLDAANRKVIGFDMSTEPVRREALDRARDTGEPAATGKVILLQEIEKEKQVGFLIYLPIYKSDETPQTIEQRRMLLDGYVYSPFRAGSFLRDVQKSISISDIAFSIYDSQQAPESILAQTHSDDLTRESEYQITQDIDIAGRKWIVEARSLPTFKIQSNTGWTLIVFTGGLIFSLLLFGMTYLETFARSKAEFIASELRESEKEKAVLLESEQIERKRAEEANKAKDEFISIVSHELRTPLNAIAGWSKILHTEKLSKTTKNQALRKIDKNLRVQTRIVEELLDFSQIISNNNSLDIREFDFSQMFENAFTEIEKFADEKGVLLVKENGINGKKISGDKERLQKVIANLLSNAVKFTPQGGKVYAGVNDREKGFEITIRDNGQGIKSEILPYIFEHFKQADSSTTRQHGGLGLGLAISRQIVKLHGGSIKVKSEGEGKGAVFTVRLPYDSKINKENGN